VPTFYERGEDNLPHAWITRMRASMQMLCPFFNTHRMLKEYSERFYVPAYNRYQHFIADNCKPARELAAWKAKLASDWRQVSVEDVNGQHASEIVVGSEVPIQARVHLGDLSPDDIEVQCYVGHVNGSGEIVDATAAPMQRVGQENGWHRYETTQRPTETGRYGYTIRVLPSHPDLESPYIPGLISWVEVK
jgi:glycogen phosphorylase